MKRLGEKIEQSSSQKLTIGNRTVDVRVVQGGMGADISTGELVGNVALNGGIGTLSAAVLHKAPRHRELLIKNLKEAKKMRLLRRIQEGNYLKNR